MAQSYSSNTACVWLPPVADARAAGMGQITAGRHRPLYDARLGTGTFAVLEPIVARVTSFNSDVAFSGSRSTCRSRLTAVATAGAAPV